MDRNTQIALFDMCSKYNDVLVVDVLNYLHRYMWVHRDMQIVVGDEALYTGHLYGFTNLMISLKNRFPNCVIVLALDGLDLTRRATNSGYKAQREHTYRVDKEMEELLTMCALVSGVYSCYHPAYEADDVIGMIANTVYDLCMKHNIPKRVYILSNDKDMYQLVRDGDMCLIHSIIQLSNPLKIVDETAVRERFNGVSPVDLVKFRAITGDASDNLKGYYRFQKKKAAEIATNFDYDEEKGTLTPKEGVRPLQSWRKSLNTIFENTQVFQDNYSVMKLKTFDFEIKSISSFEGEDDKGFAKIQEGFNVIRKYGLKQFKEALLTGRYRKLPDGLIV